MADVIIRIDINAHDKFAKLPIPTQKPSLMIAVSFFKVLSFGIETYSPF